MHCLQQEFTCTHVPSPTPHFLSQPLFEEHSGRQQLRAPKRSSAAGVGAGVVRVAVGQEPVDVPKKSSGAAMAGVGAGAAKTAVAVRVRASRIRQSGKVFLMSVSLKAGRGHPAPTFRGAARGKLRASVQRVPRP
jgi:hypothetical protein